MSASTAAVVLGASGSVGRALVTELIGSGAFRTIVTLVRRPQIEYAHMASAAGVSWREVLVIGSRHTPWVLEKLLPWFTPVTPSRFRSITASQIARAMVAVSLSQPAAGGVYHHAEMVAAGRRLGAA